MKCPHCRVAFHDAVKITALDRDKDGSWGALTRKCPECGLLIVGMEEIQWARNTQASGSRLERASPEVLLWPRTPARDALSPEVPPEFRKDYDEACDVLSLSPRASAALSRRCLQHILREKAGVKKGNLAEEIADARRAGLPAHIADVLDEVRVVGNFAAHPEKDKMTGEIVSVEPAEAEHNLIVIEALFDHFFVQPGKTQKRREALNRKLVAAGKQPLGGRSAANASGPTVAQNGSEADGD